MSSARELRTEPSAPTRWASYDAQRPDLDTTAAAARSLIARRFHPHSRGYRSGPADAARPRSGLDLPCRHEPQLWFAEAPADLERAKALCAACPIRLPCLAVAIHGTEYAGVWGGHIIDRGQIVPRKRPRGRPRKSDGRPALAGPPPPPSEEQDVITNVAPVTPDRLRTAAAHLYDAECALHTAHQSGVDTWIAAANHKLHDAVTNYLTAITTHPASQG